MYPNTVFSQFIVNNKKGDEESIGCRIRIMGYLKVRYLLEGKRVGVYFLLLGREFTTKYG